MTTKIVELPEHIEAWGFIPHFISPNSDMPLWEQVHNNYSHGGGWNDFEGFVVKLDADGMYSLQYPGDPKYVERDRFKVGNELLVLFDYSWLLWINEDTGENKVARID